MYEMQHIRQFVSREFLQKTWLTNTVIDRQQPLHVDRSVCLSAPVKANVRRISPLTMRDRNDPSEW